MQQTTERLPFTIRIVTSTADIARAALFRSVAYGRHLPDRGFVAMAHAGGVPHRVLALRVASAEAMIAAAHPMATMLFLTQHPDISIAPPG